MKKSLYFILTSIVLTTASCEKKKYPEAKESSESTFYAKLLINGQASDIYTGKENYYMYCSYKKDSSDVYNLISEFKSIGCTDCSNSLKIQINDIMPSNAGVYIDSLLKLKTYSFIAGESQSEYAVNFTSTFNKPSSTVYWDFGDGSTSTEFYPKHVFKRGIHKVQLLVTAPDNSQSALSNTIFIAQLINMNVYATPITKTDSVSFSATSMGAKGYTTYEWDFGDGSKGFGQRTRHTYSVKGSYTVKVKATDTQLNTRTFFCNTYTDDDASACAANFQFTEPVYVAPRVESKVIITYTDAQGVIFRSDNSLQPNDSKLEILSGEDFVRNENNDLVKKVKLKFNCTVYNGNQSISLQGKEVVVGLAYK